MAILNWMVGFASPAAALRRAMRLSDQGSTLEAFPLFAVAAKAGIGEAEFRIARCYLEGIGVPASRQEGGALAATRGDP